MMGLEYGASASSTYNVNFWAIVIGLVYIWTESDASEIVFKINHTAPFRNLAMAGMPDWSRFICVTKIYTSLYKYLPHQ